MSTTLRLEATDVDGRKVSAALESDDPEVVLAQWAELAPGMLARPTSVAPAVVLTGSSVTAELTSSSNGGGSAPRKMKPTKAPKAKRVPAPPAGDAALPFKCECGRGFSSARGMNKHGNAMGHSPAGAGKFPSGPIGKLPSVSEQSARDRAAAAL